MPRRTGPDPRDVIEATLKHNPYDDFATKARKVLADLAGHGLVVKYEPPAGVVERCANPAGPHPGTALVGRRCPICQWSPIDPAVTA